MIETSAQAQIRIGRNLADLTPETRLAYYYAANDKDPEPAPTPVAPPNDGLTAAARRFLDGKNLDDLDGVDREIFLGFMSVPDRPEDRQAIPQPVPFELDADKLNAAGLSAENRLAMAEAFAIADQGRKEAAEGKHPSARRVQQHQVDDAMLRIKNFLRTA